MNKKETLRKILKTKRDEISPERREEAKVKIMSELYPILAPYKYVLSFSSFRNEIDLCSLNAHLCKEGRLLLPRLEEELIVVYQVDNLSMLIPSKIGIMEPDAKTSKIIPKQSIDCALIPGLGFDESHHRIGYGKGHFDKLLIELKNCMTIGVGFKEQKLNTLLPVEHHDQILKMIILV